MRRGGEPMRAFLGKSVSIVLLAPIKLGHSTVCSRDPEENHLSKLLYGYRIVDKSRMMSAE